MIPSTDNMNKIKRRLRYSYTAAFAGFIFDLQIVISSISQDLWYSTDLFHGQWLLVWLWEL